MARDGTNRGGRRIRAGDKPEPLADKIAPHLLIGVISNVFMQELHHGDQEKVPRELLEDFKIAFENAKYRH